MKYLSVFGLLIFLASCSKNDETCTARTTDGEAMYVVNGSSVCEEQISQKNGEYCDCENR